MSSLKNKKCDTSCFLNPDKCQKKSKKGQFDPFQKIEPMHFVEKIPEALNQPHSDFGARVVISGNGLVMAVSAPLYDTKTIKKNGSVFLYEREAPSFTKPFPKWIFRQRIIQHNPKTCESEPQAKSDIEINNVKYNFGQSLALSHDGFTLTVGAPLQATDNVDGGVVYVYCKTDHHWCVTNRLTARKTNEQGVSVSDIQQDAEFGFSVAISEDASYILVGAPWADINGQTYLFKSDNNTNRYGGCRNSKKYNFVQQPTITTIGPSSECGYSVALTNRCGKPCAIVSCPNLTSSNPSFKNAGVVFVFCKNKCGVFVLEQRIEPDIPMPDIFFGITVKASLNGQYLFVEAPGVDKSVSDHGSVIDNVGSVYVFEFDAKECKYVQIAILCPDLTSLESFDLEPNGNQSSFDISNDGKVVAVGYDFVKGGIVVVYRFDECLHHFVQADIVTSFAVPKDSNDTFGSSVSLSGDGACLAVGEVSTPTNEFSFVWTYKICSS